MKKYLPLLLLLGCIAALVIGMVRLFELRFAIGDVYPPYSSLRSDPLGAMAFYESLGRVPGISTRRDFSTQNILPDKSRTVYLQLGSHPQDWNWVPSNLSRQLEKYLARGNRLVITFFPRTSWYDFGDYDQDGTNSVKSPGNKRMTPHKPTKNPDGTDDETQYVDLAERWGFDVDFMKLTQSGDVYEPVSVVNKTSLPLPRTLQWHSGLVFTNLDSSWHVLYARGTNAVLIERHIGQGSVVMATDSYFISNEAMENNRHVRLLAWLIGANTNVVFDESHFGIANRVGIAMLMRKYRLHGLAAGLLLLAGLFIWKNASSLVPPHAEQECDEYIAGKDAAAGFINLLRRSLAPRDLLSICFNEWKKSGGAAQYSAARRQQAEGIFQAETAKSARDQNPLETYNEISRVLHNK